MQRLDRGLVSSNWISLFILEPSLSICPIIPLNIAQLFLHYSDLREMFLFCPLYFIATWLRDTDYEKVIQRHWTNAKNVNQQLNVKLSRRIKLMLKI